MTPRTPAGVRGSEGALARGSAVALPLAKLLPPLRGDGISRAQPKCPLLKEGQPRRSKNVTLPQRHRRGPWGGQTTYMTPRFALSTYCFSQLRSRIRAAGTAQRCRECSRGLSEHSERYPRSSLPRVSSHACGVRGFGDPLHRGLRASRLPPATFLHRSAVPSREYVIVLTKSST